MDRRGRIQGAAMAFGLYLLVSVAFFGSRVASNPDSRSIGLGEDPPLLMWGLKWWPQALRNGWDPLHNQVVFVPEGWNMAWMTGLPGPGLALAPVTETAGPIAAYNLLAILAPALSAWAAYLLCRSLGAGYWPSVVGGYLFGFSSYVIAQTLGHANLALAFCIPLAGYLLVRRHGGSLSTRAFVAALTATLSFQFLSSTEVFLTLTMFGALIGVLAYALMADRREAIWSTAKLVALAYLLTGVIVSPFLISALSSPGALDIYSFSTDPVNLVIPTEATAVGGDALESVSGRFAGGLEEQGGYLSLPLLAIAALFWWERRDRFATILVLAALALLVATLGDHLTVLGSETPLPLPWTLFSHLPVFEYILPIRLMVYVSLLVAIMAAKWLSRGSRSRWALAAVAILLLAPNYFLALHGSQRQVLAEEARSPWDWPRPVPELFRSPEQRRVLDHRGAVLILPYHYLGDSILWQAEADMSFPMAGGYVSATVPDEYACWPIFDHLLEGSFRAEESAEFLAFLRAKGVGAVLVEQGYAETAAPLLAELPGERRQLGGMQVHLLPGGFAGEPSSSCPRTS